MVYELAQYAQTFLDEFRPWKKNQAQVQASLEPSSENDVC